MLLCPPNDILHFVGGSAWYLQPETTASFESIPLARIIIHIVSKSATILAVSLRALFFHSLLCTPIALHVVGGSAF